MIYLDNGATSFPKPEPVRQAVAEAMELCANPGRGGHAWAANAARVVYRTRESAGELFRCKPEQVVFTQNCTQGLNMAIRTLVPRGGRVVVSGFEHNAVTRPLHHLRARIRVAGRKLFDWEDTLRDFDAALRSGPDAVVLTHVSNVFGYILPLEEMAAMCRRRRIPFAVDAAQSAGMERVDFEDLGADFIAMPGHKGLLGPMGTGILLCGRLPVALMQGGTGSDSIVQKMPDYLPDRGEAGTVNVPGIAGLGAGIRLVLEHGPERIGAREAALGAAAGILLAQKGYEVFRGPNQSGTVSLRGERDCEELARALGEQEVGVRAGLHCAPLAHRSAGTLDTGTVRLSFGFGNTRQDLEELKQALDRI